MFRKILKTTAILVPLILIGIILLIAYNTYQKTQSPTESPITVIPTNAAAILQLNDVSSLNRLLKLSEIWNQLRNIKQVDVITKQSKKISNFFIAHQSVFNSNSLFISFHKVSIKKSATLFSTSFKREKLNNEQIVGLFAKDITTSQYDNQTIYHSKSLDLHFSFKKNILFYSQDKMLITDAVRTADDNTNDLFVNQSFVECYNTISKAADINLMINYNHLLTISNTFTNIKSKLTHFSGWAATDLKLKDNAILASGLSSLNSPVKNFTDIFANQKNQTLNIIEILPENTTQLFAITFSNEQEIYKKKNKILQSRKEYWNWDKHRKHLKKNSNLDYNEFISEIDNEAGIFNTSSSLSKENNYTYINTKESITANSMMQEMIISSTDYKDFRINRIIDNNFTSNLFGSLFKTDNPFFTTINNYLIFGKSKVSLEYIIDNYISENTLSNSKSFQEINSYISNKANIFLYLNPGKTFKALQKRLVNYKSTYNNPDSITKFTAFSFQLNNTRNELLHNLCLFYDKNYKEAIKEEWYFALDTISSIKPQFVYNHFTKEKMILVQDNDNNLIAINSAGEKLWHKKINSQILGSIKFIDTYRNNKFQALFNTYDQLYLIDRNGESVDGFPKNLPTPTSMGLSLFDYDKNKNYRVIIVGDDNMIYNLDKNGEPIDGWKYIKTTNQINKSPIHFIVEDKDYILQATNNSTTKLLARNGSTRTVFKDPYSFTTPVNISENGTLYTITSENKLWTASVNGKTQIIELPEIILGAKILAHNEGFFIVNGDRILYINKLNQQEMLIELDTQAEDISLIEDYITVTTQNSLYLIRNKKIVDGFPIDSDGYFNISDIDNDGKFNVINIKNGFVYNYELSNLSNK